MHTPKAQLLRRQLGGKEPADPARGEHRPRGLKRRKPGPPVANVAELVTGFKHKPLQWSRPTVAISEKEPHRLSTIELRARRPTAAMKKPESPRVCRISVPFSDGPIAHAFDQVSSIPMDKRYVEAPLDKPGSPISPPNPNSQHNQEVGGARLREDARANVVVAPGGEKEGPTRSAQIRHPHLHGAGISVRGECDLHQILVNKEEPKFARGQANASDSAERETIESLSRRMNRLNRDECILQLEKQVELFSSLRRLDSLAAQADVTLSFEEALDRLCDAYVHSTDGALSACVFMCDFAPFPDTSFVTESRFGEISGFPGKRVAPISFVASSSSSSSKESSSDPMSLWDSNRQKSLLDNFFGAAQTHAPHLHSVQTFSQLGQVFLCVRILNSFGCVAGVLGLTFSKGSQSVTANTAGGCLTQSILAARKIAVQASLLIQRTSHDHASLTEFDASQFECLEADCKAAFIRQNTYHALDLEGILRRLEQDIVALLAPAQQCARFMVDPTSQELCVECPGDPAELARWEHNKHGIRILYHERYAAKANDGGETDGLVDVWNDYDQDVESDAEHDQKQEQDDDDDNDDDDDDGEKEGEGNGVSGHATYKAGLQVVSRAQLRLNLNNTSRVLAKNCLRKKPSQWPRVCSPVVDAVLRMLFPKWFENLESNKFAILTCPLLYTCTGDQLGEPYGLVVVFASEPFARGSENVVSGFTRKMASTLECAVHAEAIRRRYLRPQAEKINQIYALRSEISFSKALQAAVVRDPAPQDLPAHLSSCAGGLLGNEQTRFWLSKRVYETLARKREELHGEKDTALLCSALRASDQAAQGGEEGFAVLQDQPPASSRFQIEGNCSTLYISCWGGLLQAQFPWQRTRKNSLDNAAKQNIIFWVSRANRYAAVASALAQRACNLRQYRALVQSLGGFEDCLKYRMRDCIASSFRTSGPCIARTDDGGTNKSLLEAPQNPYSKLCSPLINLGAALLYADAARVVPFDDTAAGSQSGFNKRRKTAAGPSLMGACLSLFGDSRLLVLQDDTIQYTKLFGLTHVFKPCIETLSKSELIADKDLTGGGHLSWGLDDDEDDDNDDEDEEEEVVDDSDAESGIDDESGVRYSRKFKLGFDSFYRRNVRRRRSLVSGKSSRRKSVSPFQSPFTLEARPQLDSSDKNFDALSSISSTSSMDSDIAFSSSCSSLSTYGTSDQGGGVDPEEPNAASSIFGASPSCLIALAKGGQKKGLLLRSKASLEEASPNSHSLLACVDHQLTHTAPCVSTRMKLKESTMQCVANVSRQVWSSSSGLVVQFLRTASQPENALRMAASADSSIGTVGLAEAWARLEHANLPGGALGGLFSRSSPESADDEKVESNQSSSKANKEFSKFATSDCDLAESVAGLSSIVLRNFHELLVLQNRVSNATLVQQILALGIDEKASPVERLGRVGYMVCKLLCCDRVTIHRVSNQLVVPVFQTSQAILRGKSRDWFDDPSTHLLRSIVDLNGESNTARCARFNMVVSHSVLTTQDINCVIEVDQQGNEYEIFSELCIPLYDRSRAQVVGVLQATNKFPRLLQSNSSARVILSTCEFSQELSLESFSLADEPLLMESGIAVVLESLVKHCDFKTTNPRALQVMIQGGNSNAMKMMTRNLVLSKAKRMFLAGRQRAQARDSSTESGERGTSPKRLSGTNEEREPVTNRKKILKMAVKRLTQDEKLRKDRERISGISRQRENKAWATTLGEDSLLQEEKQDVSALPNRATRFIPRQSRRRMDTGPQNGRVRRFVLERVLSRSKDIAGGGGEGGGGQGGTRRLRASGALGFRNQVVLAQRRQQQHAQKKE